MGWGDEPKNIIVEFLRARLTDPRSRAETIDWNTFSGTGSQQTLTLSAGSGYKIYAITEVKVDGTVKKKWEDYEIDLQNSTITGTFSSGTDNITVKFKVGDSNWIYPSLSKTTITSATKYPRIDILVVGDSGTRLGSYQSDIAERIHFQANIWVKENYRYNDGTNIWAGSSLAMYLARQIVKAFEDHIDDLYPKLYNFELITIRDAVWERDRQVYHVIVEFTLEGVSIGG